MKIGDTINLVSENRLFTIVGLDYNHDEDSIVNIELGNKARSLAGTVASLKDRGRIQQAYAQGSTTYFTESENGNADFNNPLLLQLPIPRELAIINFINLDVEITPFRVDYVATEGGGFHHVLSGGANRTHAVDVNVQSGNPINNSGAAVSTLSFTGNTGIHTGSVSLTSQGIARAGATSMPNPPDLGSEHNPGNVHFHTLSSLALELIPSHTHPMQHNHDMQHSHPMAHRHNMQHDHGMEHTHSFRLGNHVHNVQPNMQQIPLNNFWCDILINGVSRATVQGPRIQRSIARDMLNPQNILARGTTYRIEIRPHVAANIRQKVMCQGFLRARGGVTA